MLQAGAAHAEVADGQLATQHAQAQQAGDMGAVGFQGRGFHQLQRQAMGGYTVQLQQTLQHLGKVLALQHAPGDVHGHWQHLAAFAHHLVRQAKRLLQHMPGKRLFHAGKLQHWQELVRQQ